MPDETFFLFAVNVFVILLCGALFIVMPHITRKPYLFGVIIPPEQANCPQAKALKRRYTVTCTLGALLLLALCAVQFALRPELTPFAALYFPLLVIPLGFAAFVPNWKKALRLKKAEGWQVSGSPPVDALSASVLSAGTVSAQTATPRSRGSLKTLPWIWYALSFAVVAATVAAAIVQYPLLPDMIAGRLDANLQPVRWVEKTLRNVLMQPLINAATLAVMVAVAIFIEKAKMQADPARPQLSFAQRRVYRRRLGHSLGFLTLVVVLFTGVMGLPVIFPDSLEWGAGVFWFSIIALHIPIALIIVLQVTSGQGGGKIKIEAHRYAQEDVPVSLAALGAATSDMSANKSADDKHWVLGMFYYNRDDPAYFVENRFGVNFGFNYAHIPGKIAAAVLLAGIIAVYIWTTPQLL